MPPRVPTAIKKLRGTLQPCRTTNEPEPGTEHVRKPSWLQGDGARVWEKLAPELLALGVLRNTDVQTLARYCDTLAKWHLARKALDGGLVQTSVTGHGDERRSLRPEVQAYRDFGAQLLQLEREMGLTPVARARVDAVTPDDADEADEFMFGVRP